MPDPILYRKRLIPDECVLLKDDRILYRDNDRIVTKWDILKPRKDDLHHGLSCYYLREGFKVSKFYRADGSLLYWYCDIVSYEHQPDTDTYIITDLLADVIVYPDGFVKVVDIDELAAALDNGSISIDTLKASLRHLNDLLTVIYAGGFARLQQPIEQYSDS